MAVSPSAALIDDADGSWQGVRMTAEEFFRLPDDGRRYELVEGVVLMSPSPTPRHQAVAREILFQIEAHLREHPVGQVFGGTDVRIGKGVHGGDLVYRPDVVFFRTERLPRTPDDRLAGPPDLVVEVVSPDSRRYDRETKRQDYERLGVREYWLVDPLRDQLAFFRLEHGRFVEAAPVEGRFASTAVPGFTLDVDRLRAAFRPW